MMLNCTRLLCTAILVIIFASGAQAAATYSCSLGAAPSYSQTYSSTGNSSTALSVTVTCVKSGSGGGLSIDYTVTPNNGLNPSGAQNRAASGAQYINYDLYTDSSCTVPWSGAGTIVMPGGGGTTLSQTLTYYGCVPATQPTLPAALSYSDTVSLQLAVSTGGVTITGPNPRTFPVTITANATCTMSALPGTKLPGNVDFGTYTAFQGSAKTANTSFATVCTNLTPYTLSLDANGGVVSGLNYSLGLNTTPNTGGSNPLGPVSGTGSAQTYYINGTMPANQAGTCAGASCPGTNVHTLTITY